MALTRNYQETINRRVEKDPAFRIDILQEAIKALIDNDIKTCMVLLRTYVNATIGFKTLAEELGKKPKTLKKMLSTGGELASSSSVLIIVNHLKKREGVELNLTGGIDHAKIDTPIDVDIDR